MPNSTKNASNTQGVCTSTSGSTKTVQSYDFSPFQKVFPDVLDLRGAKDGLREMQCHYLEMSLFIETSERAVMYYTHPNALNHSNYLSEIIKCLEQVLENENQ